MQTEHTAVKPHEQTLERLNRTVKMLNEHLEALDKGKESFDAEDQKVVFRGLSKHLSTLSKALEDNFNRLEYKRDLDVLELEAKIETLNIEIDSLSCGGYSWK